MHRTPTLLAAVLATFALTAIAPPMSIAAATRLGTPSDFDGDGFVDLAIGVPGEDIGVHRDAGSVNVLYGAAGGLSAVGDQAWSQDSAGVLGTSEGSPTIAGDAFGSALASADFDRDGRSDLAIGVPLDRVGAIPFAGAVNVLYGSKSGLTAVGDQRWSQAELVDDPEKGDGFGQSLATGDFDRDGYADLAIGVPAEGLGVSQAPGMVMIVRGGAGGLGTTGAQALTRAMTGAPYLADTPHGFGYALAAGDLDGDGYADLAVGAPASGTSGDDPLRPLVDGEVSVFYGGAAGLSAVGSQVWTQDSSGVPGTGEGGDWFGSSLAIADFDRDHHDDLAIGTRFDRVAGLIAGAVNVLYGTASGLSVDGAQLWDQDVAGVPGSAESGDTFGHALASGDLDGDGFADLAIGAPGEALGSGWNGAGLVDVLYGTSAGLAAAGAQAWTQNSAGVPGSAEASETAWDAFGSSLAIGDFGRSKSDDLAIGVHLERLGTHREAGLVDVLYGRASGISGVGAQGWSQDSPGVAGAAETRDYFGTSLAP